MSEWDYTNERELFWMDLNRDFERVCSTIASQNIYGCAPMIVLLTMRPSRLFVKIRCHAVPSTRKRSAVRKKRKRQFYGNKFTNTSKKNSTLAVPECTASCSKLGKESFSTAEEMPGPVFGNRIVDLELIVEAFAQLCCPKCFAEKVELFEDSRYGLCSHFKLKCKGFAGAFKLCSTLNLPRLTKTAYKNQEAKLLKVVQEVAEESMIKAATEIVEKQQNLSSDIVKCGISVDGTWQRRGYTSMNACVAAISVDTGKVLDIEVMSSYCPTCKRLQTMPRNFEYESSKADHICQCNFTGSLHQKWKLWGLPEYFFDLKKTADCNTLNIMGMETQKLS
ncbi:uncharacterized protein TNCV_3145261 [Trichonephila clavipes]|nr:uncharacterized protein TNCV_3145261 [Trichonephila clavipes]